MTKYTLILDYTVSGRDAGWIAITAAEGGVNYWAKAAGEGYRPSRWYPDNVDAPIDVADDFVFYRLRYENPNDDNPEFLEADVTPELIGRGLVLMLEGKVRKDLAAQVIDGIRDEDGVGMIDADAADCAIQLGIFGEVVFG